MKYELPCAVVRDLLPSYVEELTEAETTAAVKEHLETCADCRKRYEAMTGGEAVSVSEEKEIDYLRKVRRNNGRRVIIAVVLAVVLVLTGVGVKLFWIGKPCDASSISMQTALAEDSTKLQLRLDEMNSGFTIVGLKTEYRDGVMRITAREVLSTPFHDSGVESMILSLEGVRKVEVFGRTVWQEETVIDSHTNRLLLCKTPYVGDAPAMSQLISNMDLDVPATIELQTEKEPYGVTIHFTEAIQETRHLWMERNAYVLLALVDNLGKVSWDDPSGYADSLTLDTANEALPGLAADYNKENGTDLHPMDSVKDYGTDDYHLQVLRNMLGI